MKAYLPHDISEFGQAAMALDQQLVRFEALSHELERVTVGSDKGLDRALAVLQDIHTCREKMEVGMRTLAQKLAETQERHQKTEHLVSERTAAIEMRKQEAEALTRRFRSLGEKVHAINASVDTFRKRPAGEITAEEKREWMNALPELDRHMGTLVDEAKSLVTEARSANLLSLEKNADALRKSLSAARNRITLLLRPESVPQAN